MFKSYLKASWRNLIRNKGISLINITGLSIGLACAILILLLLHREFSYDQFHVKRDRIFQLYTGSVVDGKMQYDQRTPMLLAPVLKSNFPQVEEITRTNWERNFILTVGDRHLQMTGLITDTGFFRIFTFPLKVGNPETVVSSRRNIVITEKLAKMLFGNTEAMGKLIRVDSNAFFKVTGVMKDYPTNTQFGCDYILPWTYMKEVGWENTNWKDNTIATYVLLKPGVSEKTADARFRHTLHTQLSEDTSELFLHPLRKLWLYSNFDTGQIKTDRLIGMIGGIILLIACMNYLNLNTALSIKRGKEVSIRKISGAKRSVLIFQFLSESIIIALISGVIALIIAQFSLHWFNTLMNEQLSIPYNDFYFWLAGVGLILITGVIAGIYPAFYLSAHKPINTLKGTGKAASTFFTPRKVLVVLQFTSAITFIVSTIVIFNQIDFARKRYSGYNSGHLVYVYIQGDINKNYQLIKNELLKNDAALIVTRSNSPISDIWSADSYSWSGKDPNEKINFDEFHTDNDFVNATGLQIISGRDIDVNIYPTDSTAVLINESAEKVLSFKDPIGQTLKSSAGSWHIVGVVKDFIAESPFAQTPPMIIQGPKNYWFGAVTIKLNKKLATNDNLKKIEEVFHKYNPDYPFACYFADNAYAGKFEDQQSIGTQAAIFGGLSILISCLGLFALATYTAESRIKEIGIRKVLGASTAAIAVLLAKEFLNLIAISFLIASSISWWVMNKWLQGFSYRINISFFVFFVAGIVTVGIALLSVSYQSMKAALANPIKSLRTE